MDFGTLAGVTPDVPARRPLKSRDTRWAAAIARWLAAAGFRPNGISVLSVGFAALAGAALAGTGHIGRGGQAGLFVLAALGIQLRLLCNLFDGMVAVEGGFRTRSGEIYNELPDRLADIAIFVGAGYAAGSQPVLGWAAAVAAVTTAYVRALGASAGAGQHFVGPMAKPHRMALLTVTCLILAGLALAGSGFRLMPVALWVVIVGCGVTMVRRCRRIVRGLEAA